MSITDKLFILFGSKTRVKILNLFFSNPKKQFFVRELEREVKVQINAIRRELVNLKKVGLIDCVVSKNKQGGNHYKFYKLRKDSEFYKNLRRIIL